MLDLTRWINAFGLLVVFGLIGVTVFAESGLLVGIILPGDTLLIAVGVLAAQGSLPLLPALGVIFLGAVFGDNIGYYIGRRMGKRLFKKRDSILFKRAYVLRAQKFFKKHGGKTVLVARFIPYVRTFTPMVAGAANMDHATFITYNILGALPWAAVTVLAGYWLGDRIPNMHNYLYLGIASIGMFVCMPTLWHLFGDPATRRRLKRAFKRSNGL
jgi:membrane-associated protein